MANKNGKRKVPKHKAGRTPKLQVVDDECELDDMSQTASLMSGLPSASKRNSHRRFAFGIGLLVGLCLLMVLIAGVLAVNLKSAFEENDNNNESPAELKKHNPAYGLSTDDVFLQHQASSLNSKALRRVANAVDEQDLRAEELNPLLIPRVSGTPGNEQARNHILSRLQSLGGWAIELDTFQERAPRPHGMKTFTNIVATANPATNRRLVLACHYDSKFFEPSGGQDFIGATDSALPCAQILYLARRLNDSLKQANNTNPPVTLQLIFFDGEEAFVKWTSADSIYGARHLANRMQATPHPPGARSTNQLHGMDMFILLDLLGARNPSISNYFRSTTRWYNHLVEIENRLKRGRLTSRYNNPYFNGVQRFGGGIEDDHIPFLRKGVRILHLIPAPFPSVWHTMRDNAGALDDGTISNLSKILHVFIAEYLSLPV